MSDNSAIEWTDATWNPVVGCSPVSEGCRNCYAATMARRLDAMGQPAYMARPDRSLQQIQREDDVGLATALHRQKAVRIAEVRGGRAVFTGDVRTIEQRLIDPLGWRKPRRIFVCSMSDLFHPKVPFEFIDRVFAVMNATGTQLPLPRDLAKSKPWHTYQVLTKRPERMAEYMLSRSPKHYEQGAHPLFRVRGEVFKGHGPDLMNAAACLEWPPSNVWLGTSCEDQAAANARVPHLMRCPAAVRFLSCEPLLGALSIERALCTCPWPEDAMRTRHLLDCNADTRRPEDQRRWARLHWAIVGGESGPRSRPCNVEWVRSIVRQCYAAKVSCFVKQLGSWPAVEQPVTTEHISHTECIDNSGQGVAISGDSKDGFCAFADAEGEWQSCSVDYVRSLRVLKRLNDRKGGDPSEWPEELRVRELPGGAA